MQQDGSRQAGQVEVVRHLPPILLEPWAGGVLVTEGDSLAHAAAWWGGGRGAVPWRTECPPWRMGGSWQLQRRAAARRC